MIQGFAWISCRAVTAELGVLPRETRQEWKVPRSGFICDLLECGKFGGRNDHIGENSGLGAGGTDWGDAATKARSSLNTAFNYLIVSAENPVWDNIW